MSDTRVLVNPDPQSAATDLVSNTPIETGHIVESPLGERLGLWRFGENDFEISYHGSNLRGTKALAVQAVARFMRNESQRSALIGQALATLGEAPVNMPASSARN